MTNWSECIIDVNNLKDHENIQHDPKQVGSIRLTAPGRYCIHLMKCTQQNHQEIQNQIKQHYGLQDQSLEIQLIQLPQQKGDAFRYILSSAKITIQGDLQLFLGSNGIGQIKGSRKIIDDGNTIVIHFWDAQFNYVLMQEIKY